MNFFVYFMHFVLPVCTLSNVHYVCDWHAFNKCNLLACLSSLQQCCRSAVCIAMLCCKKHYKCGHKTPLLRRQINFAILANNFRDQNILGAKTWLWQLRLWCGTWMLAGLGNIAALCTSRRVTICQEGNEFASVGTATHELGHKSVFTSHYYTAFINSRSGKFRTFGTWRQGC